MTAGLEVDAGLSINGGFGATFAAIHQRHAKQLATFQRQPSSITLTQAGIIPASGSLLIDVSLGNGPYLGHQWMVRRASVSDAGNFTATMGAAVGQFYVGLPTELATVRPNLVGWPFATLPNTATFGNDEMPVLYGQHLLFLVTGGTVGQTVMASATVQLFRPQDIGAGAAQV
jgi:hypothetical protein